MFESISEENVFLLVTGITNKNTLNPQNEIHFSPKWLFIFCVLLRFQKDFLLKAH
jgi:hypothetical protein